MIKGKPRRESFRIPTYWDYPILRDQPVNYRWSTPEEEDIVRFALEIDKMVKMVEDSHK